LQNLSERGDYLETQKDVLIDENYYNSFIKSKGFYKDDDVSIFEDN